MADPLDALAKAGIIDAGKWRGTPIGWVDELLRKALPQVDARVTNGITDFAIALQTLVDADVINTPEYWRARPDTHSLIIRLADKCRNILDRIVEAEACDQPDGGRELVANVIFNRVKSKGFPNTVYGVVFEPGQFAPVRDGGYKRAKPAGKARKAVDAVLAGKDGSRGATYFIMTNAAPGSWHERALRKLFEHGSHTFFDEG